MDRAAGSNRSSKPTNEARIIAAATAFFAEHGFRASTRDLARRLGATQPLIYRYFSSKQALIDQVFEETFRKLWSPSLPDALLAGSGPIELRLTRFYRDFLQHFDNTSMRLFLRAILDDPQVAQSYDLFLKNRVLMPVVEALRRELGLPALRRKIMRRAEQELAATLHASVLHLAIRKFMHGAPLPDDLGVHITFSVHVFLTAALPVMHAIHRDTQNGRLAAHLKFGISGR